MTADLNLPVEIVGMPIVRDDDGLAMSSRNVYLSGEERQQALALVATLRRSVELVRNGESDASTILDAALERLSVEPDLQIDYVKICHAQTLEDAAVVDRQSVMLLAAKVGKTRLIDNSLLVE
jgi:pantoate--beta-alanine ligase